MATSRQMACWTQHTHFGMSDWGEGGGAGKHDQSRKEAVSEVVKWLKPQVSK